MKDLHQQIAHAFIAAKPLKRSIHSYTAQLETLGRLTPSVQEAIDKAKTVQATHDLIFYIAGPLTGMPEHIKQRYANLSGLIAAHDKPRAKMFGYAPHLHGTDPIKHPFITPQEVRDIDYLWSTVVANGHCNFWSPVAHGNAIEAAWAELYQIPSIYLAAKGVTLSRLVRGMHNIVGTLTYDEFDDNALAEIKLTLDAIEHVYVQSTNS